MQKAKSASKQSKPNQKSINQWNQCIKCDLIVPKCSNEEHACNQLSALIETNRPFLFQNLTYLTSVEHSKDLIKDVQIGREYLFDFAFLNPMTMKLSNFRLGDLIVIKDLNTNVNAVVLAWSSPLVDFNQIALNNIYSSLTNIPLDKFVLCFKPNHAPQLALDVKLSYALDQFNIDQDCDLVLAYLKEIYLGKYVLLDQPMFVSYMGQKLIFKIENILANNSTVDSKILNGDDLSHNLAASLNLSEKPAGFTEINMKAKLVNSQLMNEFQIETDLTNQIYQVNSQTKFSLALKKITNNDVKSAETNFKLADIAGLDKEIELLKEFFIQPFQFCDLYKQVGVELSKGILLYGSSGCGKTVLANALCNELKCKFLELKITNIYSKNYGETESKLKDFFSEALKCSPCVVLIDEIDTLCSRKETLNQETEKRILNLFISLLDQSTNVLFLCLTNKIDNIDLSLRRPGRLDKEIEIPIPNQKARYAILRKKLEKLEHDLKDEEILEIAQNCHGYVGADLELLVKESGLICIKRLMTMSSPTKSEAKISKNDLLVSLRKIKPSAMREITFDIPKVYWHQIGGQHELKKKLEQAIIWPIKYADSFKRLNIKAPRGLLMYGPPGCSKTMIAKALATETGLNFIAVKGPELFSKWVGESERTVREIFRKARNASPAIIFFDEIDAVATERSNSSNKSNSSVGDRVLAQLLNEMDGVENLNDVTIVAATNRPDMIDKALMRPGRLDRIVYVTLPDKETRKEIFNLKFKQTPVDSDVDLEYLVEKTHKYSGAEIAALCNEAAFLALETSLESTRISMSNFQKALEIVTPRTSDETIKYFDNFSFNSGLHEI